MVASPFFFWRGPHSGTQTRPRQAVDATRSRGQHPDRLAPAATGPVEVHWKSSRSGGYRSPRVSSPLGAGLRPRRNRRPKVSQAEFFALNTSSRRRTFPGKVFPVRAHPHRNPKHQRGSYPPSVRTKLRANPRTYLRGLPRNHRRRSRPECGSRQTKNTSGRGPYSRALTEPRIWSHTPPGHAGITRGAGTTPADWPEIASDITTPPGTAARYIVPAVSMTRIKATTRATTSCSVDSVNMTDAH